MKNFLQKPLVFLFCLFLFTLPHNLDAGEDKNDPKQQQKTASKKRDGADPAAAANANENNVDPPKPTPEPTPAPCNCTAECSKINTTSTDVDETNGHGFGASSVFVAILFGMGLMFALGQLYTFWEKRRLGDSATYRGY